MMCKVILVERRTLSVPPFFTVPLSTISTSVKGATTKAAPAKR
jgi:hypothetical protein